MSRSSHRALFSRFVHGLAAMALGAGVLAGLTAVTVLATSSPASATVPPLSVSTTSLPAGTVGVAYSATLAATGGTTPYTWALISGSLPAGISLNASSGTITGTPSAPGIASFTVRVTDSSGKSGHPCRRVAERHRRGGGWRNPAETASANLSITVSVPFSVTTTSLPSASIGNSYSVTLAATGGTTPYTWALTGGSLPARLSLDASSGAITGTPTASGTSNFTVTVTDSSSPAKTASANLSITVSPPGFSVTTTSLPGGIVGVAYSATLAATGGITPYAWKVTSGSLPAGLSLNASSGAITGTPSASGTSSFTVTVTDSSSPTKTASANLSITVSATVPGAPTALGAVAGNTQVVLSWTAPASNGGSAITGYDVYKGTSPGTESVTPVATAVSGTTYTMTGLTNGTTYYFTVEAVNAVGNSAPSNEASATPAAPLAVTTTSLPSGTFASSYSATVAATDGITPYTWKVTGGSLPTGLSLNASSGAITGTPSASGTSNFTVTVTDSSSPVKTASATLSITVSATVPGAPRVLSAVAGNTQVALLWSAATSNGGSAITGFDVYKGTSPGAESATPVATAVSGTTYTVTGLTNGTTYYFTIEAVNAVGNSASSNEASATPVQPLSVTTTSLPPGLVGNSYSATLAAAGGTTPYTWSLTSGSLPAGLSLSASSGMITGTPSASGISGLTVTVTDSSSPAKTASASLLITVSAAPLSVTTTSLPPGLVGTSYSATLAAAGGITPYTWALISGSLPAGLSLSASSGMITGTPSASGISGLTVLVTDSSSPAETASASLLITVSIPFSVTTTSLPSGTVGNSYSATLAATHGTTPYSWTVTSGSLPAGLSLSASSGAITGTPSASGTSSFTVQATDSSSPAKTASASLSITVSPPGFSVTTTSLPSGTVGSSYSATLAATDGTTPYTWALTSGLLPAGLSLSASSGTITGTPSASGTSSFTVTVTDSSSSAKTASASLSITISLAPLSVTTTSLPAGTVGSSYSATLTAAGGITPYTWAVITESLPAGLSLNTSTGAITGTPSASGISGLAVLVTDSSSPAETATATLSITVSH